MLAITSTPSSTRPLLQTPNLLPCALNHNGPIPISPRHWNPTTLPALPVAETNSQLVTTPPPVREAYFRGRRLLARPLALPDAYEGFLLQAFDTPLPPRKRRVDDDDSCSNTGRRANDQTAGQDSGNEDEEHVEEPIEVKPLEKKARFEELVVWGHEAVPGEKGGEDDVYAKGVDEWIRFAEVVSLSFSSAFEDNLGLMEWMDMRAG